MSSATAQKRPLRKIRTMSVAGGSPELFAEFRKANAKAFRGFEALTVEALRDLRTEKDAQIDALKAENDNLKARLKAAKSAVAVSLA